MLYREILRLFSGGIREGTPGVALSAPSPPPPPPVPYLARAEYVFKPLTLSLRFLLLLTLLPSRSNGEVCIRRCSWCVIGRKTKTVGKEQMEKGKWKGRKKNGWKQEGEETGRGEERKQGGKCKKATTRKIERIERIEKEENKGKQMQKKQFMGRMYGSDVQLVYSWYPLFFFTVWLVPVTLGV